MTYDKPRPISQAPKDGTMILLKFKPGRGRGLRYEIAYYDGEFGWATWCGAFSAKDIAGWWPLPEDFKAE